MQSKTERFPARSLAGGKASTTKLSNACLALLLGATFGCAKEEHQPVAPASSQGSEESAPGKDGPGVTADCNPWSTLEEGPFRYVNDQWGSNKARGDFEQCLLKRPYESGTEYGWTWSWPGRDVSVFAYPSATFGWKPWAGGAATDSRLPIRVGDISHLELRFDVETEASGTYNLAPELWFTNQGDAPAQADPSRITREVMFWFEYEGGATPAGRIVETTTFGKAQYELWKIDSMGKEVNGTGWTLLTFKRSETAAQGNLPIHEFLEYLVEKELLGADEYLSSIEFGNELMGGSGTTWVRQLAIELDP